MTGRTGLGGRARAAGTIALATIMLAGCAQPFLALAPEPASAPRETLADAPASKHVEKGTRSRLAMPTSKRAGVVAADRERASRLQPMIAKYAKEQGVPFALANAVVRLESRYVPEAKNGPNVGLTQINVRTARSLGYKGGVEGLFDPETNLRFGIKYLAQAYELADGDTCGTILRYQAGHRAERMTPAAQAYCGRVKTIIASST